MKTWSARDVPWKIALWISWVAILAIFIFGAAVNVDFVDPSVAFSDAWNSMTWAHAVGGFQQQEYSLFFAVLTGCVVLFTCLPPSKARLGMLVVGAIMPVLLIGPVMLGVMLVAPWMVSSVLIYQMDGEFYEEGMLMIAACGLGMLLLFGLAVRDALKLLGGRKLAKQNA